MHTISPEQHPIGPLRREGFKISLNTDSRLLYRGDVSSELDVMTRFHGFTLDDIQAITVAAVDAASAMTRPGKRCSLVSNVVSLSPETNHDSALVGIADLGLCPDVRGWLISVEPDRVESY
jgi:hypothetical protein